MDKGFEELFVEVNNIVETKRRRLELLTKEYAVLLKPWPSQKKGSSEDGEEKDASEGSAGQQAVPVQEQVELDLVEKFLNRAQKARDVQKKIDTKQTRERRSGARRLSEEKEDNGEAGEQEQTDIEYGICSQENLNIVNKIRHEVRNELLQGTTNPKENCPSDKTRKVSENTVASQPRGSSQVNSVSHTKDSFRVESTSHARSSQIKSASGGSHVSQSESVSNSRSSSHTKTASRGRSDSTASGSLCRNSSHNRNASHNMSHDRNVKERSSVSKPPRPSSGRTYSAHVKAPFKTDPNVRVPKTSTSKAAMAVHKGHSTTRPGSGGTKSQRPKLTEHINSNVKTGMTKPVGSKSTSSDYDRHVTNTQEQTGLTNTQTLGENVASPPLVQAASNVKTFDNPHVEPPSKPVNPKAISVQTADSPHVYPLTGSVNPADRLSNKMEGLQVSEADVQEKRFTLQQDGGKINIPSRFRRKVAANEKLREKVATQRVTKKVGSFDTKMEFLERLERGFHPDSDLVIQTRAMSCLDAYQRLHQLLEGLKLSHITELSSASTILRAKMMMEYILASCDSLQREAETLVEVEYSAHLNKQSSPLQIQRETTLSQWLPHRCMRDVQLPCPSVITYRTFKELQQYKHQVFQLQYLHLQSVVMEMAIRKLLPLLQNLDPKSREYIMMYRAVYAFLSSAEAQHLPGIVKESM
ncbi:uncharacterized protein LOC124277989 [Haliotis rubra]|uniref:uncharacterized protein LOC124277989 n=1 Tax=Haliotis rubra TaxID=36100 RepID=UPI001EE53711|nr:uncharacterized protein LOC124277989 [Haliotis rubra]